MFDILSSEAGGAEGALKNVLKSVVARAKGRLQGDGVDTRSFERAVDEMSEAIFKKADLNFDSVPVNEKYQKDAAIASEGGTGGAGRLRFIYKEVLEEVRAKPNGLMLFEVDESVPLGYKMHTVERFSTRGEAKVWNGTGGQIPTVNAAHTSKTFNVRYYVTAILWDFFEELAENVANVGRLRILMAAAIEVMEQFASDKTLWGDDANGIYGLFNYPWVTHLTLSGPTAYSLAADVSAVNTEAHIKELVRFVTYSTTASKGAYKPTRIAWGVKFDAFMSGTLVKTATTLTPMSLKERFLQANPYIKNESQITVMHEFDDAFGEGVSAILAYNPAKTSVANVIPGGGIQDLPIVDKGSFEKFKPLFMAHGGLVMRRVGDTTIGMVDTTGA